MQDDGTGASPQAFEAADAYGIMGMRERAGHFGGQIRIESILGRGTHMELSLVLTPGEVT